MYLHILFIVQRMASKQNIPARYKIEEIQKTLFNVGFHKQITLATRAITDKQRCKNKCNRALK